MFLTNTYGAVTTLTLNHPPVNAISEAWVSAFEAKLDALAGTACTVLHIRSDQKVFCAGADLKEMRVRMDLADGPDRMYAYVAGIQRLYARIEKLPRLRWPRSAARRWAAASNWRSPAICGSRPMKRKSACRKPASA